MDYTLFTPLGYSRLGALRAGDTISLTGTVYTARDAAHARLADMIKAGEALPFPLRGAIIYYAGPTPAPPGRPIGSVGPTTSGRMDPYTPLLLEQGLAAMIGKGPRSAEVLAAMQKSGAVYFGFIGGAGALAAQRIAACETIAFPELGSEAVRKLAVQNFPLTVLADAHGGDLYISGPAAYLASLESEGDTP